MLQGLILLFGIFHLNTSSLSLSLSQTLSLSLSQSLSLSLKFVDSGACGSVADLQVEIVEVDLLYDLNLGCGTQVKLLITLVLTVQVSDEQNLIRQAQKNER